MDSVFLLVRQFLLERTVAVVGARSDSARGRHRTRILSGGSRNSNNSSRNTIVVSFFATTVRREPRCNHRDHAVPIQNHKYDVVPLQ